MPAFAAISKERHAEKRWLSFGSDFRFAAQTSVAPLVAKELPKALMAFPIGFIRHDDLFNPAAILSFESNRNLFVAYDGRWIGGYQPAIFRGFPFRLISTADDKLTLCIDEESGLVTEGPEGEPFFENGEISERIKQIMDFLTLLEQDRIKTTRACAALDQYGVIKPWEIKIKGAEIEYKVEGIFQVDEAALNALPLEELGDLQKSGALLIAYCQLLSMQHLPILGRLADAHTKHRQQVENVMKQSFQAPTEDEISIDWSVFSDDDSEKG